MALVCIKKLDVHIVQGFLQILADSKNAVSFLEAMLQKLPPNPQVIYTLTRDGITFALTRKSSRIICG